MIDNLIKSVPFITPIWKCTYPNFNQDKDLFIRIVKQFRNENSSLHKSNVGGGYQSPFNLMHKQELSPLYDFIIQQSLEICGELNMNSIRIGISGSWVNINDKRSASNISHNHEGILSGIFYLKAPHGSGKIYFKNPGMNTLWEGFRFVEQRNEMTGELVNVDPIEGEILIWPSYLHHGVLPNEHDDERISIAFNVSGIPANMINDGK